MMKSYCLFTISVIERGRQITILGEKINYALRQQQAQQEKWILSMGV